MKWYIIRHGQTDYNKMGVVQGSGIDAPLNETGREQAEAFYQENKHLKFDKIYISELIRTHQSVEKFIENTSHEVLPGLNEICWGEKEGTEVSHEPGSYYMKMVTEWKNGNINYSVKGGESPVQVAKRQIEAIEKIKSDGFENVLICMHGRAIRILISQLLNTPLKDMDQYVHSNLCLYVLEWDGIEFALKVENRVLKRVIC